MNKTAILCALALSLGAGAQQKQGGQQQAGQQQSGQKQASPEEQQRFLRRMTKPVPEPLVYEFKHLDRETAEAVTRLASEILTVNGSFNRALSLAYFRKFGENAQETEWKPKVLDFLKRYDVPPPPQAQVYYLAYLIRASNAEPGAREKSTPAPAELGDAISEMKRSLNYRRFDLLTTVSSISEGGASASDRLPDEGLAHRYYIGYGAVTVSPDRKSISIRPFQFRLESPANVVLSSISSDITVHEGQKLVLGKVRLTDDADIFVILTAKVE